MDEKRQPVLVRLRRQTHRALRQLALDRNTTLQALLEQAAERIVEKAGAPR